MKKLIFDIDDLFKVYKYDYILSVISGTDYIFGNIIKFIDNND